MKIKRIKAVDPDFRLLRVNGHGSLDEFGRYHCVATGKKFQHDPERVGCFHGDGWFYEGVWNRELDKEIAILCDAWNIPTIEVSHPWYDYRLDTLVDMCNDIDLTYPKCIGISPHSNASPEHNARGFEVWTARSRSWNTVWMASMLAEEVKREYPNWSHRGVKQKNHTITSRTNMPFILSENGFFDQAEDAQFIFRRGTIYGLALAHVRMVIRYLERYRLADIEYYHTN